MVVRPLENTVCYKCPKKIMAMVGAVHPLCVECQDSFDDWFERELAVFNG
jgi:hypothetical protein